MKLKDSDGRWWRIKSGNSIFVSRKGKTDVSVRMETDHGGREDDGKRYSTMALFDSETGEVVRNYGPLAPEITVPQLRAWGFIAKQPA